MNRLAIVPGLACVLVISVANAPPSASVPELGELLRRFDDVQQQVRTLSADFIETTESALLTAPIVARGRVFLTKPDSVRWEYDSPEQMRFVIRDDEYTGYFPERKEAERRDIHRWSEQLFRFLGLGQASAELLKFYDITLGDPSAGPARPGTHLLVMDPKKRRVSKRVDLVLFWIDDETYMPVRVEYRGKSGNRRVVEFARMSVNPDLAVNLYRVEIPPDVEIKNGFSALSGFSTSNN